MSGKVIEISLFGACSIRGLGADAFEITGSKHRALLALLATAPFGRRTRSFLQETLWGVACYDTGRQSLRRALADIKQVMGDSYGKVLSSTNSDVTLDLAVVSFLGAPGIGDFLEGLDIRETGFAQWLAGIRQNAAQLEGLFGHRRHSILPAPLPVVTVLPFRAISSDPHDAILGDWLAEEICRSLSRSKLLAVISHLSSRQFIKTGFDLAGVESVLQAHFCLAGSLRRVDGKLVLDLDFVDVTSSRILFTRQIAYAAEDFLGLSAAGIGVVVKAVGAAIADEAISHSVGHVPAEIADHRLLVAGVGLMHRTTLRDFARARELIEEALRRAPRTPEIHAWLSKWYIHGIFNGWSSDTPREKQLALDHSARALDLSPDNAFCLTIDGFAHSNLFRRLDIAEQRYDLALSSNPNEALCWLLKSALHTFRNEGDQAVRAAETARALSPIDPFGYYYDAHTAGAYLATGDYDRALELAERSLRKNDRHLSTLRILLFAAYYADKSEKFRAAAEDLMRRQPDFTVSEYMKTHPSADSEMGRKMERVLIAAQIPLGG